jgi:hypothetical protein
MQPNNPDKRSQVKENLFNNLPGIIINCTVIIPVIKWSVRIVANKIADWTFLQEELVEDKENLQEKKLDIEQCIDDLRENMKAEVEVFAHKLISDCINTNKASIDSTSISSILSSNMTESSREGAILNRIYVKYTQKYPSLNNEPSTLSEFHAYHNLFIQLLLTELNNIEHTIGYNRNLAQHYYIHLIVTDYYNSSIWYRGDNTKNPQINNLDDVVFKYYLWKQIEKGQDKIIKDLDSYIISIKTWQSISTKLHNINHLIRRERVNQIISGGLWAVLIAGAPNLLPQIPKFLGHTNVIAKDQLKFNQYGEVLNKAINQKRKTLSDNIQKKVDFNSESAEAAINILFGNGNYSSISHSDLKKYYEQNIRITKSDLYFSRKLKSKYGLINEREQLIQKLKDIARLNNQNKELHHIISTTIAKTMQSNLIIQNQTLQKTKPKDKVIIDPLIKPLNVSIISSFLNLEELNLVKTNNSHSNKAIEKRVVESVDSLPTQDSPTLQSQFEYKTITFTSINKGITETKQVSSWKYLEYLKEHDSQLKNSPSGIELPMRILETINTSTYNEESDESHVDFYNHVIIDDLVFKGSDSPFNSIKYGINPNYISSNKYFLEQLNQSGLETQQIIALINGYKLSSEFVVTTTHKNLSLKSLNRIRQIDNNRKFGELIEIDPTDKELFDLETRVNTNINNKEGGFDKEIKILKLSTQQTTNTRQSIYFILIKNDLK